MLIRNELLMTRDPNGLLLTSGVSNEPGPMSFNARPSTRLIALNLDVQTHIMSFLSKQDLSALMRTCRHFLDACVPSLCAHSGDLLHEIDLTVVPKFHQFLRIDSGPSSRAHLIKELWIAVSGTYYQLDVDEIIGGTTRRHWSSAFLHILRHCDNLRQLRIDLWLDDNIPFPLLVDAISSLKRLEDLTLYLPRGLQDAEVDTLRKLAGLPLRRLAFLKYREIFPILDHAPVPLEGLPRSLVELDIDVCMPVSHPFANVRTLGVRVPTSGPFVADATTAFPNVTLLILRRHVEQDVLISISRLWGSVSAYPTRSSTQRGPVAIPVSGSVAVAVRGLGRRSVHAIRGRVLETGAVPFCPVRERGGRGVHGVGAGRHLSEVPGAPGSHRRSPLGTAGGLAVASGPVGILCSAPEVAVRNGLGQPQPLWQRRPHGGCLCKSLCLFRGCRRTDSMHRWTKDDICATLPALTGLTHMLIKFAAKKTPCPEFECRPLDEYEVEAVEEAIKTYLPRFEQECTSLQWVAFDVYDLDLECWEIPRAGGGASEEGQGTRSGQSSWTKTSRESGLAVLSREGMDAFRDVQPSLAALSLLREEDEEEEYGTDEEPEWTMYFFGRC